MLFTGPTLLKLWPHVVKVSGKGYFFLNGNTVEASVFDAGSKCIIFFSTKNNPAPMGEGGPDFTSGFLLWLGKVVKAAGR